jgi:hypothetical protein
MFTMTRALVPPLRCVLIMNLFASSIRLRRGSGASKESSFRAANLAELHRAPSILVQSWYARRGALLLLCKAAISLRDRKRRRLTLMGTQWRFLTFSYDSRNLMVLFGNSCLSCNRCCVRDIASLGARREYLLAINLLDFVWRHI